MRVARLTVCCVQSDRRDVGHVDSSVVDPNTLNLDLDPGFWPNLDSDPGPDPG